MKRMVLAILISALLLLTACNNSHPTGTGDSSEEASAPARPEKTLPAEETSPVVPARPTKETKPDLPPYPASDSEFVRILDYIPSARQMLPYATTANFTGRRIYDFEDAYLRSGTVKKLSAAASEFESLGYGIMIWDGFRPTAAQDRLWEICPDANVVSAPTGRRTHCRGMAVDITLFDLETEKLLQMPSEFDDFTAAGDRDYSDCSEIQKQNSELMETVMTRHGFEPLSSEWWHFSDSTDYPVEDGFYPIQSEYWTPDCDDFINLRTQPGSDQVICQIPLGESFTLKGWTGFYGIAEYQGHKGYVHSAYIRPADPVPLTIKDNAASYSYNQMMTDLKKLSVNHNLTLENIGHSEDGREIPVLRIGRESAPYHILIHGGIHGREHMTSWLVTALADYWLNHDILSYGNICLHILPMVNPDGVMISQNQTLSDEQRKIYKLDLANGLTNLNETDYARMWKANAKGVDPNRNFPSGWEEITQRLHPSSERYRGEAPLSTSEMAALAHYTMKYPMDATISYHCFGSIIYYEYGNRQPVNNLSYDFAKTVEAITGYPLVGCGDVDGAGYGDWTIDELGIPSLTIEIGCASPPLEKREMSSILARNLRVLPTTINWVIDHNKAE